MPRQLVGADEELAARRAWVRALAAPEPGMLSAWLGRHVPRQEDLAWLSRQGLVLFAYYRLQQAELLERLPSDVAARWAEIYQQGTVGIASMDWEIERVLLALTQTGVDFIWLKGGALAYAVYPNPACRARGDLDLWVQAEQLPLATAALQGLGYRLHGKLDRPDALALLVGGEQQMVHSNSVVGLIELQWPALRGEWVRHTTAVDHAAIWQRRSPVAVVSQSFYAMASEDALIHLCVHQAINHQFSAPSWLRNLLDIHLLVATQSLDWNQLVDSAIRWRLATVVWTVLRLSQRLLDTPLPAASLQALAPSRWQRWLIDRLDLDRSLLTMQARGYGHYRFVIQLVLVDRARDGARLLWRGLAPEAAWLQARYSVAPGRSLWRLRLLHVWRVATSARA
ncbi:MAG TPA: nucleotidyltransferase family protein [Anaerolineae bacterium]|nr:nucleotidyltransferase family protein [Anaerolineae bacterium]